MVVPSDVRPSLVQKIAYCVNQSVSLLAVTKYASIDQVQMLYNHGIRIMAENTVQKLVEKQVLFPDVKWHIIGPLQRNKVNKAVTHAACIQSVDRLAIATAINTAAARLGRVMPIMLQLNLANHPDRAGFLDDHLDEAIETVMACDNLQMTGFMVMGPHPATDDEITTVFSRAKSLFDQYQAHCPDLKTLSMGMSQDFNCAIACGSNQVRLGSYLLDDTLRL